MDYLTYSVDLAHHEIFRAKVGKGGIKGTILDPRYSKNIRRCHFVTRSHIDRRFSFAHFSISFAHFDSFI